MLGRQFRIPGPTREILRLGDRFLSLDRKLIEIHGLPRIESSGLTSRNRQNLPFIPNVQLSGARRNADVPVGWLAGVSARVA
jgi:hypothetical protein